MPYNTKKIITDITGKNPVPSYFNPNSDQYEPLYGQNGGNRVLIWGANDQPLLTQENPGYFQLTGSNVSKEYLQNVTVTAGSNVGTGNIDFSGTRIGVGIRLDRSAKFRVHGLSKRPGASGTVGVDLIIDRSENAASSYPESYVLKSTRYDIQVSNVDTTDFVVSFLAITDFLA